MNVSDRGRAGRNEVAQRLQRGLTRLARNLRGLRLPHEMTQERLSALSVIRQNAPISISALADLEHVRPPTMSRMVASMFRDGLVIRRDHKTDGRGVLVSLTAKGRRVFEQAGSAYVAHLHGALAEPTPEQVEALKALSDALEPPRRGGGYESRSGGRRPAGSVAAL